MSGLVCVKSVCTYLFVLWLSELLLLKLRVELSSYVDNCQLLPLYTDNTFLWFKLNLFKNSFVRMSFYLNLLCKGKAL